MKRKNGNGFRHIHTWTNKQIRYTSTRCAIKGNVKGTKAYNMVHR